MAARPTRVTRSVKARVRGRSALRSSPKTSRTRTSRPGGSSSSSAQQRPTSRRAVADRVELRPGEHPQEPVDALQQALGVVRVVGEDAGRLDVAGPDSASSGDSSRWLVGRRPRRGVRHLGDPLAAVPEVAMGDARDRRGERAAGRRARRGPVPVGGILAGGPAPAGRAQGHREQSEGLAEHVPRLGRGGGEGGHQALEPDEAVAARSARGREGGARRASDSSDHGEVRAARIGPDRVAISSR